MVKGKEKFALWITPECKQLVDDCYADDQCQSCSEYIEKAILFYTGFLYAEKADRYLPKVLQQILSGTLDRFAERIGRQLFKLAVEQNVNNHILASDTDIDARSYYIIAHLRADNGKEKKGRKVASYGGAECCLKRISTARIKKRTAARTSLEAAFSWEGFSSIMRNVCIFIRVFPMDEL